MIKSIQEIVKEFTGETISISGGNGTSLTEAIIISPNKRAEIPEIENTILNSILAHQGIKDFVQSRKMIHNNYRTIEEIKIEYFQEEKLLCQNYYFEILISLPFDPTFSLSKNLLLIKKRLLELGEMDNFNQQFIKVIKEGELFNPENDDDRIKFINILFKDKSIKLFEDVFKYAGIPMLKVLQKMEKILNEPDVYSLKYPN
jgi:hypothetical protein